MARETIKLFALKALALLQFRGGRYFNLAERGITEILFAGVEIAQQQLRQGVVQFSPWPFLGRPQFARRSRSAMAPGRSPRSNRSSPRSRRATGSLGLARVAAFDLFQMGCQRG